MAEGVIPPEQVAQIQDLLGTTPESMSSIAFSYGMLMGDDIDEILDEQRTTSRSFGEIALTKGLLTTEQIKALIAIQPIRTTTRVAEALVLARVCPVEEIMGHLSRFLSQHPGSIACGKY
jgi:hypothetical protein